MYLVASTFKNGAPTNSANRRAISVLPTPVGPIMMIFFGVTSLRNSAGAAATTRRLTLGGGDSINGKALDDSRVELVVKKGDVEIWAVQNQSVVYHSLHIHDVQFLVLDRDGKAPPAYEAGWKDTVIVNPFETIRLIMQFKDYADPTLPYMFHCHILEHEDLGMMEQFVVVENLTDTVRLQSPLLAMPSVPTVQP